MMFVVEFSICKNCFYKNRTNPHPECPHGHKLNVKWNEKEKRLETTTNCRPFPKRIPSTIRLGIAMCDPHRGSCKEQKCTFAHGRVEQKTWNSILRFRREQEGKRWKSVQ